MGIDLKEVDEICRQLELEEKKEFAPESLRNKYLELFKYVDLLNGVIVSVGTHPAGVLCATRDIDSEIGLFSLSTTDYPVSSLDMYGLDDGWWTKLDCLGLDNVGIINETCKIANIERINPDNLDLNDWEVWKDIRNDTTGIFQFESPFATMTMGKMFSDETIEKIRKKIPNISYLKLMSFCNALIRPCGASIIKDATSGIFNTTGIKEIDDMLLPEMGYCIIQEDIMKFLMEFCGFSLNESDKARKVIAKKKGIGAINKLIPVIRDGFNKTAKIKYNLSEEESCNIIEPIIQCIFDANRYAFSWNHSDAYSFIGYACGWLRHYYPLEFISTCLNIWSDNEEKTKTMFDYAKERKIIISEPKFRHSRASYYMDKKNNSIYKGISSIKYMNSVVAEEIFSLRDKEYKYFFNLLEDIKNLTGINSRQLEILIKLDFFSEFGNSKFLLRVLRFYEEYGKSKTISKDKLSDGTISSIIKRYGRETAKKFMDLDNEKILCEVETYLSCIGVEDSTMKEKILWQKEYLGYIGFCSNKEEDRTKLMILDTRELISKKTGKLWKICIKTMSIGSGKTSELLVEPNIFSEKTLHKYDIIQINPNLLYSTEWNGRKSWNLRNYEQIIM